MANKPNIRFKGFTDDWEQRKLGDSLLLLKDGTHGTHADANEGPLLLSAKNIKDGNIKWDDTDRRISLEEYEKIHSKFNLKSGDVLLTIVGSIGETAILQDSESLTFQRSVAFLRPQNDITSEFLYSEIQSEYFQKELESRKSTSAQPGIYLGDLAEIPLYFPFVIDEQKKIGSYFANLDHLITLHQRKCDETKKLKKFMLQKMFPKNGEKNPEIRFAGFTDDWEQRKLGEICERLTRKNKDNESDLPLTISSQHGLIDQRDFFNKVVAAKDMSEYYLLQKGEFAYNKSYSNGYDYGSIKRLNSYEKGCLSTLYICFKLISDKVNSDYLECYLDTLAWYHDVSQICSEGARNHGLLNVDVKAFFTEVTVKLPVDVKEQQQISAILHSLDHLITLHQRKCDKLKLIKKFMLQNMFPKKG